MGMCIQFVRRAACCGHLLCNDCAVSDRAYKAVPTCLFCRRSGYTTSQLDDFGVPLPPSEGTPAATPCPLEGVWDLRIVESSQVGTSKIDITLEIDSNSGKYVSARDGNHYDDGSWNDIEFGHTPSGKTFVAKQEIHHSPSWLGHGASVNRLAGLRGRLSGPNSAKFTSSMSIVSARGDDELEIVQQGEMVRRVPRRITLP